MRSALESFGEEFAGHLGRPCPLPRELPAPWIADFDERTRRFVHGDLSQVDG